MNSARHSPNNLAKLGISTVVAVREPTGSIFCQFKGHKCTRDKVATERFCLRHLALQRDSAIKQCNYVSAKSSIRCSNRVERNDCNKDGYNELVVV